MRGILEDREGGRGEGVFRMMGFDMSKEREKYRKVWNDGRTERYSKIF
jgi:hypothetical protein